VDGIKFDSTIESEFYEYLVYELGLKNNKDFILQMKYLLIKPFEFNGKTVKGTLYFSDFTLKNNVIIDIKGRIVTPLFRLKNKMMKRKYDKEILMVTKAPKYYEKETGDKWVLLENMNKIKKCHKEKKDLTRLKLKRRLKDFMKGVK
jgi:hypothetical protein